jgi:hypothetical protein
MVLTLSLSYILARERKPLQMADIRPVDAGQHGSVAN